MTSLEQTINQSEYDLGLRSLASSTHCARGHVFEFYVCRLIDSGQYRIYVAKDGERCGYIFDPMHDVQSTAGSASELTIIEDLINAAKCDVDMNTNDFY